MKIAILADIHGNSPALKAVLDEIDARRDIEHIYCAGDMIGIGPFSNEVLTLLFARNDVSMVTGNHDEAIVSLVEDEKYPLSHNDSKEHHQWMAKHLDRSFIPALKKLPRIIQQDIEGHSILVTHYHIQPAKLLDSIHLDPFSKIVQPTADNMMSLFKDYDANLIIFGHHHPMHFFQNNHTSYLNHGSLGCSHHTLASYSIVDIRKEGIQIEFCAAAYDKASFLSSYEHLKVPDREFILKVFHGA